MILNANAKWNPVLSIYQIIGIKIYVIIDEATQ